MENGEVVLEVEKEELALDRPPTATQSSSPKNGKRVLKNTDHQDDIRIGYQDFNVGVRQSDIVQNTHTEEEQEFDTIGAKEIELANINHISATSGDISSANDNLTADAIPPISTADAINLRLYNEKSSKIIADKKHIRYFNGKPLLSCLKLNLNDANKEKMSVHYLGEETNCVKEYIDPVDPWKDVRTPSNTEVISFYRNTCQKLRCKAIDKVIKQIQEIGDLSCRAGTLILRGTRLDNKSCEALESVFRRVQFENLDLENCSLEEDGAAALLEMIEFYHSTCKLNIACNPKIGVRGWQALCRMLRKTPSLTYLDARRTLLTDMTMPTFGRCLKTDPPLKILHLEGVFLSGRPMLILTTAMKYNKILEELYLGDNDLSPSDGPPIGAMLTYNTTLQLLDLRNNQIKDIGLAHVGNGLSDQSELCQGGLCSLILWNNGLTHDGMTYLSDGLVQTSSLKALNLGQNRIGDLGIQKLKIGLIKNKSLHKLGFLNTKLGSEGAVALAEVLADSLSITRIDIRENNIQTAGLMAFAMALKVNHSLLRLDLDKDIRKETGMEQVMQSVLVDIYNFCHRNKQLARHQFTSSSSSSDSPTPVSRQSSISSEYNESSHINTNDIFHPESDKHNVVPFSPVYTDPSNVSVMQFPPKKCKTSTSTPPTASGEIPPTIDVSKSTQKEILNAMSSQAHELPKNEQSVHILNKPTINSSDRRASRFSVTKILDSLGTHAAGVANKLVHGTSLDTSKLKKPPQPKDEYQKEIVEIELESTTNTRPCLDASVVKEPMLNGDHTSLKHDDGDNMETSDKLEGEKECNELIEDAVESQTNDSNDVNDEGDMSILELASQYVSGIDQPNVEQENIPNQILNNEESVETKEGIICERKHGELSQHPLSNIEQEPMEENENEFAVVEDDPEKDNNPEIFIPHEGSDLLLVSEEEGGSEYTKTLLTSHAIPVDSPS